MRLKRTTQNARKGQVYTRLCILALFEFTIFCAIIFPDDRKEGFSQWAIFDKLFGGKHDAAPKFAGEKMTVMAPIDGTVIPLEQIHR